MEQGSPLGVGLVVDGVYRTSAGFHNMLMALAAEDENEYNELAAPSNIGGVVGAIIDYAAETSDHRYENIGSISNDVFTMAADPLKVAKFGSFWGSVDNLVYITSAGKTGYDMYNNFVPRDYIQHSNPEYSNHGNMRGSILLKEIVITPETNE